MPLVPRFPFRALRTLQLAWALAFVLVSAATASAQLVPGWNTKQFTLERLDADRIRLMREVEIEGEKGTPNEGQKFFADDMELNTCTGEFDGQRQRGVRHARRTRLRRSVVFNTRTKLGTFTLASGIASLGERGEQDRSMFGTHRAGHLLLRRDDREDRRRTSTGSRKGGFTTCVQPTPRWEIVSGNATVNLRRLRDAAQRRDARQGRAGLLPAGDVLPDPGRRPRHRVPAARPTAARRYRGQSISNAFFWAINRNQDATFMHDWFASRGQGGGGEYRYIVSPQSQGDFRAYTLKEHASDDRRPERARAHQLSAERQRRHRRCRRACAARARVDYFSDITAQQLYNNNLYQQTYSTRSIGGGIVGGVERAERVGHLPAERVVLQHQRLVRQRPGAGRRSRRSAGRRIGKLPLYASANFDASTRAVSAEEVGI